MERKPSKRIQCHNPHDRQILAHVPGNTRTMITTVPLESRQLGWRTWCSCTSASQSLSSQDVTRQTPDPNMVNVNHATGISQGADAPPTLPSALYGAVAVGLAIFFIGVTLHMPPTEGYVVSAEVEFIPQETPVLDESSSFSRASNSAPGPSLQQIATAAHAASYRLGDNAPDASTSRLSTRRLRELLARINTRATGLDGRNRRIALTYRGRNLAWSLAFVNHLAEHFVLEEPDEPVSTAPLSQSIREAKWHVRQARHYERKARLDMQAGLNLHFERLQAAYNQPEIDTAHSNETRTTKRLPTGTSPASQRNVAWAHLEDELVQLKSDLNALQAELPAGHSVARRIAARIERLEPQLHATRPHRGETAECIRTSATESAPSARASRGSRPIAYASLDRAPRGLSGKRATGATAYRQLRAHYEAAISRREAAEEKLSELALLRERSPRKKTTCETRMVRPARLAGQIGGEASAEVVLIIGLLSSTCGLLMYWRIASLGALAHINSTEELQQILALPLVGRISIAPLSPRLRRRPLWGACVRWSTRAAEFVLLAIVVLFLWSVLRETPALSELATNPFAAIADRVTGTYGL